MKFDSQIREGVPCSSLWMSMLTQSREHGTRNWMTEFVCQNSVGSQMEE